MSLNLKRGVLRHDISKADYKKEPARPQTALIPPIRRASLRLGTGGGLLDRVAGHSQDTLTLQKFGSASSPRITS